VRAKTVAGKTGYSPCVPSPASRSAYTIGAIFLVYGAAAALVVELLGLIGLQGARPGMWIWPGFVFAPLIPACLALTGRALMRGSSWGYRAGLLLPLVIVPLAVWSLNGPGRPATFGAAALQATGVGAVLSALSVPFSLALVFIQVRTLPQDGEQPRDGTAN